MSTYLDFRCRDCNENACLSLHKYGIDNEFFLKILAARETICALRQVQSVGGLLSGDLDLLPEFFWRHTGHAIVLENGYGQEYISPLVAWSESRFL